MNLERRDFVKGAVAAAAVSALPGLHAAEEEMSVDGHVFPD